MIKDRRKTAQSTHAESEPKLDLSSLVDVSFLLLIYFLVTSTLQLPDADLGAKMTKTGGTGGIVIEKPTIEIDAKGQISMMGEVLEGANDSRKLPVLRDRLAFYLDTWELVPTGRKSGVVIEADNSAKGQRFVDVLNCLADVGINDVVLADFANEE